uniref:Uncharacterized protein n=1 Tax=Strongyloides papillosus TaxID=174720 RepID=A0A0N5B700_STREA
MKLEIKLVQELYDIEMCKISDVKFTSPFDTSPIRRNGRRNSSSNNDRSPSRRRGSSRDRNRRLNGNAHGQGSLPYYNQYRRNHRNHIRDIQQRGRSYYRISFN